MTDIDPPPSLDGGNAAARFGEALEASAEPKLRPVVFEPLDAAEELAKAKLRLSAHLARARGIEAEVAGHRAAIRRLDPLTAEQGEAAAALAAFEAEEADAIRRWAAEPSDLPPPAPRMERRAALAEALAAAEQRSTAARAARQGAESEIVRLSGVMAALEAELVALKASVMTWSAQPIVDRVKSTLKQLEVDVFGLNAITVLLLEQEDLAARGPMAAVIRAKAIDFRERVEFVAPFVELLGGRFRMMGSPLPRAVAGALDTWRAFFADLSEEEDDATSRN